MLKSGIVLNDINQDTTLGVPQGGVLSPLLFNIYMHEFDKIINEHLENLQKELNITRKGKKNHTMEYKKITSKIKNEKNKAETAKKRGNKDQFFKCLKLRAKYQNESRKIKSTSFAKTPIRFLYVRYADDWIIITNSSLAIIEDVKEFIAKTLSENFKLQLSENKIVITSLQDSEAHFLGFVICNNQKISKTITFTDKKQE